MNSPAKTLLESQAELLNKLNRHGDVMTDIINLIEIIPGTDKRWVALARSNMSTGLTALKYAVSSSML